MRAHRLVAWVLVGVIAVGMFAIVLTAVSVADPTVKERIDNNTYIVNSTVTEQSDNATITIHSEITQEIVLTDAGGMMESGEVQRRRITLQANETRQIKMPVTKRGGRVAITVATRETLYAHVVEIEKYLFYEDPDWSVVQAGSVVSGLGVLGAVGFDILRRRIGGRTEVRRLG